MNPWPTEELENLPGPRGQGREQLKIQDLGAANRALKKISAARAAIKEREALARAEINRVQRWLEEETKTLGQKVAFYEGLLHEYHRRELARDPSAKTIRLPHGVLKMRRRPPEYRRDLDVILKWAGANKPGVLVPRPPKLDWAGLKKTIQAVDGRAVDTHTGEIIPGITIVDRPPKFSVEVD